MERDALPTDGAADAGEGLDRLRRRAGVVLAPVVFLLLLLSPLGLEPRAHRTAALVGLAVILWMSEALPLAATALLIPALGVLLAVSTVRDAFAPFGDPVIFLFLGSFLLAEALRVHGLDRRLALRILGIPGVAGSPGRVRLAVALVTALLSMWISNTATAAMMLPIALGLVRALAAAGSKESPRATLLMVGIAASLGGLATPVGTPPNLITMGFLDRAGMPLDFLRFMAVGVPLSLLLTAVALTATNLLLPVARGEAGVADYVAAERGRVGRWGSGQTACAVAFAFAIGLWLLPGVLALGGVPAGSLLAHASSRLDEATVAVLAAVLLFAWPVAGRRALTWEDGARIDWGTLLLFGGGLSLGKMMFESGLAAALGRGIVDATGVSSLWGLTALAIATTIVFTETTSNTATVTMLAPLVLALAKELGVPPVPPLLGVCFGASMGFMFPVGTPPNALVYGTGLVPMTAMMRIGVIVDILSFFVILGVLRVLCPLLGLA